MSLKQMQFLDGASAGKQEPKENKLFDSSEQLSKIAQDLVRRKTEQKPLKWCSQCGHKCPLPPQHTWEGCYANECAGAIRARGEQA